MTPKIGLLLCAILYVTFILVSIFVTILYKDKLSNIKCVHHPVTNRFVTMSIWFNIFKTKTSVLFLKSLFRWYYKFKLYISIKGVLCILSEGHLQLIYKMCRPPLPFSILCCTMNVCMYFWGKSHWCTPWHLSTK